MVMDRFWKISPRGVPDPSTTKAMFRGSVLKTKSKANR